MSINKKKSIKIPLFEWVEEIKDNDIIYQDRQIVEILLTAIGLSGKLKKNLYLKGGTLLALAFRSERLTADVDFSCVIKDHAEFAESLRNHLNPLLLRTANTIGYLDIVCQVQTIKKMPRPKIFDHANFPALKVTIGYAKKDTPDEKRLMKGLSTRTIEIDISFNEQIYAFQELILDDPLIRINAYAPIEVIAEKFRAIIQQKSRNRIRRQDAFDINHLLGLFQYSSADKQEILDIFLKKSASRDMDVSSQSMDDHEIKERSKREWDTLQEEIQGVLPDFEETYERVKKFYEDLPW
ncbi:MAG: nucleotidyl transferase AbiEii/AbiGii toxin family protein [Rhodobacteraceae bacterium]|nr:nucleotidyl transferase AbiEii/AbiGii toxin family protein [Paracoccaceae bacterium]